MSLIKQMYLVMKAGDLIATRNIAERRELQAINVNSLMGVDYSSSNMNISDNHAVVIQNLLKKNNVLQKRNGWSQILSIEEGQAHDSLNQNIAFTNGSTINGIWQIKYKSEINIIAHIGQDLFFINNFDSNGFDSITLDKIEKDDSIVILNEKSWGIVANDRIYILCGSYIVVKLSKDENNKTIATISNVYDDIDTYVPTTTIGITPEGVNTSIIRLSYDDVNIMSPYRINTLLFLEKEELMGGYRFVLDSNPKINITTNSSGEVMHKETEYFDIKINYLYKAEIDEDEKEISINAYITWIKAPLSTSNQTVEERFLIFQEGYEPTRTTIQHAITSNGYLGEMVLTDTTTLIFNNFYKPIQTSKDNVIVKYKDDREDESTLISNCKFGILYGAGNVRNRLFLSGNPNTPNTDYHSSQRNIYASDDDVDLQDNQDYTYFSVFDYCNYGTTNSAVMGYQIMGDGSLLVIKEKVNNEPTVYFRKGTYETRTITFGDNLTTDVYVDKYPMTVGNIGEGLIVQNGLFNLNNDIVFLSENGLYGISSTISSSTLASDYQYAYSRSRLINKELIFNYDLKNAVCILYDNKLFMTLKNKTSEEIVTFVADGRYKYKLVDSIDNEYEYEWFILKNINADNYYIINNKLYFSNNKGLFYWNLYSNSYKDIKYARTINDGTMTISNSIVTINEDFKSKYINETTLLKFNKIQTANLMFIPLNSTKDEDGYYTIDMVYNKFMSQKEGLECLFGASSNVTKVYLKPNLYNQNKFKFYTTKNMNDNEEYTFSTAEMIYFQLDINEYKYKLGLNELDQQVILGDNDEIIQFRLATINPDISFQSYELIPCYYVTKSYNCGQSTYKKVLRTLTITNDSELYSKVNFAIATKDSVTFNTQIIDMKSNYLSGTSGLSDLYENIFKADLTSKTFASSFTKDFLLKFNYIQFIFYNNDDENCVINNLSMFYTYGFKQKGVY